MLVGWVAAHAASPPEATRVPAVPAGFCVSSVPLAGKLARDDREPWAGAVRVLAGMNGDRDAIARWWATFAPTADAMAPHPAVEGLRGVVAAVLDPQAATALTVLAEQFPKDMCLQSSAAVASLAAGDLDGARRFAGRAYIPAPSADLAYVLGEVIVGQHELERLGPVLDRGLAMDPDHAGLHKLRATQAVLDGDPDAAAADLEALAKAGDRSLEPMIRDLRWKQGKIDDYLRFSARLGAPVAIVPDLEHAEHPLEALRAAVGATGPTLPVTLVTSMGDIPCELFVDQAPVTVAAFVGLATGRQPWTDPRTGLPGEGPLYRDLVFHRVIPSFMIQGGDPLGNGTGGPGYEFGDETRPSLSFDRPGRLAMANAGPGTNGSQFFVTDAPTQHLDGRHTIFGQCGAPEVVNAIATAPRDPRDVPFSPILLKEIRIGG